MTVVTPAVRDETEQRPVMATNAVVAVLAMRPVDLVPSLGIDTVTIGMAGPDNWTVMAAIAPTFGSGGRRGEGNRRDCNQDSSQEHASV